MTRRALRMTAAIGVVASFSAQADPPGGDIVDQILHPTSILVAPSMAPVSIAQPTPPAPTASVPVYPVPASTPLATAVVQPPVLAAPAAPQPVARAPTPAGQPSPRAAATLMTTEPDIIGRTTATISLPAPTPPSLRWRGFFAGFNFGAGWIGGGSGSSCLNSITNNTNGCIVIPLGGLHTHGVLGGAQVGYMTPVEPGNGMPPLMIGGETDFQDSGMSGSQVAAPPLSLVGFPPCTDCSFNATQSIDWFGTTRVRLGIPLDNLLVYATGGLIYGDIKTSQSITFGSGSGNYAGTTHNMRVGPTAGGGIELLVTGPWAARLEGLYYDLGTVRNVAQPLGNAATNFSEAKTFGFRGGIVRLGVNIQLGDIIF